MPPRKKFRKGLIRQSLNSLDRGRIPLPGWFVDCIALWSFSTTLIALALVLGDSVVVLLLLTVSMMLALIGAWIFFFNLLELVKTVRAEYIWKTEYDILHRPGDLEYLRQVVSAGKRSIGQAHPDATTISHRVRENSSALSVCLRASKKGGPSLYGYVLLYPVKDEIGDGVLSGAIRSEAEFGPDPLRSSFSGARYLYVAMIWGANAHGRWHIKDRLREMMLEALTGNRVVSVFARPGSIFGEAMMREYGFTPIKDRDGVWSVEAARLNRRLAAERAVNKAIIAEGSPDSFRGRQGDEPLRQQ